MPIENQLNLLNDLDKAGPRDRSPKKESIPEEPVKSFEQEYWDRIDALDGINREENQRLAEKYAPQILENIKKKKEPIVVRRSISIRENKQDERERPYEDIYPYSRNFRRKKDRIQ